MHLLYQPNEVELSREEQPPKFDAAKFDAAIDWVYTQRRYTASMLAQEPGLDLVRETANLLTEAFDEGIASGVIPPEMDAKLRESVFLFSACKTHHELVEVASMLRTETGGIKPFEQFAREVKTVHTDYNVNYLNAEYKFAVSSAQMSAKWADVERDGDHYDLQYRTADDAKVRHAHQLLHNKTLPPSDPFWDQYYPPNGWGCRCDAVQVRKAKYERSDPKQAAKDGYEATRQVSGNVDKGAIFRFNPGKSRQLFPPKHPYYKLSGGDKKHVAQVVENLTKPITTKEELSAFVDEMNTNHKWFERGFKTLDIERKKHCNGSTNLQGTIWLTKERMGLSISGCNKLRNGLAIDNNEADALATLWHEITHNRNKAPLVRQTRLQTSRMELANELVTRNTLHEFYEAMGSKLQHPEFVENRKSTGYNTMVRNYCAIIRGVGADHKAVVESVKTHLFNETYTEQDKGLVGALEQNQGTRKLSKQQIATLVRHCDLCDENTFQRGLDKMLLGE